MEKGTAKKKWDEQKKKGLRSPQRSPFPKVGCPDVKSLTSCLETHSLMKHIGSLDGATLSQSDRV